MFYYTENIFTEDRKSKTKKEIRYNKNLDISVTNILPPAIFLLFVRKNQLLQSEKNYSFLLYSRFDDTKVI